MDPSLLAEQQRRQRAAPTAEEYTNTLSMYQKRVAWSEEVSARGRRKQEAGASLLRLRGRRRTAAASPPRRHPALKHKNANARLSNQPSNPPNTTNNTNNTNNTNRRTPSSPL